MENIDTSASQARALLAQFVTSKGGFDHKAFVVEMDRRSMQMHGRELTRAQRAHLAKIVDAYMGEVA